MKSKLQKSKNNSRSKYWKNKADSLWGQVIHEIFQTCAINSNCAGRIEAHHLISRSNVVTRHKIEVGIGLCSKHHKFDKYLSAHTAPLAFSEWMITERPKQWQWCSENNRTIGKPDYKQAYADLKEWCNANAPHVL